MVDVERLLQVHGDLAPGCIDRGERLAVELVDPLRHFLHAAGQDAAHGLVAADAHVPSEPLLLATTATLPLSDLMSDAAPAPAAVISACEPRYCCALLRRSPETHADAVGSLIQPRPPSRMLLPLVPLA